jgi:hypothetical protein
MKSPTIARMLAMPVSRHAAEARSALTAASDAAIDVARYGCAALEHSRFFTLLKAPYPPDEVIRYVFAGYAHALELDRRRLGLCIGARADCCRDAAEELVRAAAATVLRHCRARRVAAYGDVLREAGAGAELDATATSDATRRYADWTDRRFAACGASVFEVGAAVVGVCRPRATPSSSPTSRAGTRGARRSRRVASRGRLTNGCAST